MREKKRTVPCTLTIKKVISDLELTRVYTSQAFIDRVGVNLKEKVLPEALRSGDDYEMTYIWGLDVLRTCDCDCVVRGFCVFSS